jgi:hypothetical protein
MVLVALFVFSFIGIATLSAEEGKVTVKSINAETGEMVVEDAAGETKSLMADPKVVDLKVFKEGDMVVLEIDEAGAVTSAVPAQ